MQLSPEPNGVDSRVATRPRCACVDLDDKACAAWLAEAVKASECTRELFFKYSKTKNTEGAGWQEIWKVRHHLADLLTLTRGNLLRMKRFDSQVSTFCKSIGKDFSEDMISLIARRPWLMISHLWNCKLNRGVVLKNSSNSKHW